MTAKTALLLATFIAFPGFAASQLPVGQRAFFTESVYHGCTRTANAKATNQPTTGPETEKRSESVARLCNCAATYLVDNLDADTTRTLQSQQEFNPSLLNQIVQNLSGNAQQAVEWCKENYAQYKPAPPNWASHQNKNTNGSVLFNGRTHRFTAFIQEVYATNRQLLESNRVEPGARLLDLAIQADRVSATLSDARSGQRVALTPLPEPSPKAKEFGYDFNYFIPEGESELLVNSGRNVIMLVQQNPREGRIYQTYFVRTNALLCTALAEAKSRAIASAATSILKEVLLAALRSYAGASYSRGNFTAYTSTGNAVSGTYTLYDSSWLGEHYSRGIEAVFQGAATLSQINAEIARAQCNHG